MPKRARPLEERFLESFTTEPNSGCWLWLGSLNNKGYAFLGGPRGFGTRAAHRVSYELFKGLIPAGFTVDHLCRTRSCVNPVHLETVPHSVNVKRGRLGGVNRARAFKIGSCSRGHAYTEENTYRCLSRGNYSGRQCRKCLSERNQNRKVKVSRG